MISALSLSDVRCFAGDQRANLAKITLLVGENSVGKTTFLGCLNAIAKLAKLHHLSDSDNWFNRSPYKFGGFDTIVRSGSAAFRVGLELDEGPVREIDIEFARGRGGHPAEIGLGMKLDGQTNGSAADFQIIRLDADSRAERWQFKGPGFQFLLRQIDVSDSQFTTWLARVMDLGLVPFGGDSTRFRIQTRLDSEAGSIAFAKFTNFLRQRMQNPPQTPSKVISIGSNVLSPQRIYQSNALIKRLDGLDKRRVNQLGRSLGLFDRIDTHLIGPNAIKVTVDVTGELFSLNDVGHGVTSALPFLIELTDAPAHSLFLLQQPEVHLHPSAQSKLVSMIAGSNHEFVIETHSDHVIDWCRILAREQRLSPSDVKIIYFEAQHDDASTTLLHQISLDDQSNLENQPPSYREFFSIETDRLLGLQQ